MTALIRSVLVAVVGLALAGGVLAGPAGAHGGDGQFSVEQAEPQSGGSVHYVVRLVWSDDGHAAVGATVTATATSPDGETRTPVPMSPVDQDGRYEATLRFPASGTWTVRFTAINPTGTLEQPQDVTVETTPSSSSDSSSSTPGPTGTSGPEETASSSDDDGSSSGPVLAAIAIAVLVAAAVAFGLRRALLKPRPAGPAGAATDGDEDDS